MDEATIFLIFPAASVPALTSCRRRSFALSSVILPKTLRPAAESRNATMRRSLNCRWSFQSSAPGAGMSIICTWCAATVRRSSWLITSRRVAFLTGIHYRYPVHVQPGLASGARIAGSLETTERAAREILSLPIYPSLSRENQERVIASMRAFFER